MMGSTLFSMAAWGIKPKTSRTTDVEVAAAAKVREEQDKSDVAKMKEAQAAAKMKDVKKACKWILYLP
jgi:hypothetical protein